MKSLNCALVALTACLFASAQNLVQNSSFEAVDSHGRPVGWIVSPGRANAEISVIEGESMSGSHCLQIKNPTGYGPHIYGSISQRLPPLMLAGKEYTISFYAKSANPGYVWYGGGQSWRFRKRLELPNDEWTRVSFTIRPENRDMPFEFRINTDSKTDGVLIDDVQIEEGTQATPYVWLPPLQENQARLALLPFHTSPNLVSNPSFEKLSAIRPQDWVWDKRNTDSTCEVVHDDVPNGSNALRFTNKTGYGAHVYGWFGQLGSIKVKPATKYTIALTAKSSNDRAAWFGGGDGWVYRQRIPKTDGKWKRISYTFTTREDETSFPLMLVVENVVEQLDVDEFIFVEGELPASTWTLENPVDEISFKPVTTALHYHRNSAFLPYWDKESYPQDEWLFTDSEIQFNGFIGLAKPTKDVAANIVILDQDGKELASTQAKLPNHDLPAWQATLTCNPGDTSTGKIAVKTTLKAGDETLVAAERTVNLVNAKSILAKTELLRKRNDALQTKVDSLKDLPSPSMPRLAPIIVKRFLDYQPDNIRAKQCNRAWFELAKLEQILDEYEKTVDGMVAGTIPLPPPVPTYQTSKITVDGTSSKATVRLPDGTLDENFPVFFTGHGHFRQVRKDVDVFPDYGVNYIQVEHGPTSMLPNETDVRTDAIEGFIEVAKRAEKSNVSITLLLSPHYFPRWALEKYPHLEDCTGGFFKYCTHAPESRAVIEKYLRNVIPMVKDLPAIHSFCLSNEPICNNSENCRVVKEIWPKWLEKRHKTLDELNAKWGTEYKSFTEIPIPTPRPKYPMTPLAYDYTQFNQETFAEFHSWMAGVVHEMAPHIPVHAKIMMSAHFGRSAAGIWSVSPELFGELSQYNGNDACNWTSGHSLYYSTWNSYLRAYDFQKSVADKPVNNTENHLIFDRDFNDYWPIHCYTAHIQGAIHGQTCSAMWVWERTNDPASDLAGSVLHRPRHIMAVSQAAMDLMRNAYQVTALQKATRNVALVWSNSSDHYGNAPQMQTLGNAWTALAFLDQPTAFLTERTLDKVLETGSLPEHLKSIKLIILPSVDNLATNARKALDLLKAKGCKLVALNHITTRDEYNRSIPGGWGAQKPDATLEGQLEDHIDTMQSILARAGIVSNALFVDSSGKPIQGVQIRSTVYEGKPLVNLCNQTRFPVTGTLKLKGIATASRDFISLKDFDATLTLAPLQPVILQTK
jgi:hypothetical protein